MRNQRHGTRRSRNLTAAARLNCELLEQRRLLSAVPYDQLPPAPEFDWAIETQEASRLATQNPGEGGPDAVSIVWTNRGATSDNFDATFGTNAFWARAVVDTALDDWERVITSWNRSDGTSTLQVTIQMNTASGGTGFGAVAGPAATAPTDGKPRTGSITLNRGNDSSDPNDANGWYLDPSPQDHAEFGTSITNAFAGRGTGLGPDLYSVVSIELTHVLGLISDKNNNGGSFDKYLLESSGLATNTGIRDDAEGGNSFGRFWTFDGPTVDHLMTSYNSGDPTSASWGNIVHSAGVRATPLAFAGQQWQGAEDVGNALYNTSSERTIPSWTMAHVLKDAYGYSMVEPERFGSFYANLNRSNGELTIRGGDLHNTGTTVSDDVINIYTSGSDLWVEVNVSNDIPGTRHLSGPGNLPSWGSRFPIADVQQIYVEAGGGNDTVYVMDLDQPLTVNGGPGDDVFEIGGGDFDSQIDAHVIVNGGSGTDTLIIDDQTDVMGSDTYTLGGTVTTGTLAKAFGGTLSWSQSQIENVDLFSSPNNDLINIEYVAPGVALQVLDLVGNDVINVGDDDFDTNIRGTVSVLSGSGSDLVNVLDADDLDDDEYRIAGNVFDKPSFGTGQLTLGTDVEALTIDGSNGHNEWTVPSLASGLSLTLNGATGDETFVIGGGDFDTQVDANILINAGPGTDTIVLDDVMDGLNADTYNIGGNSTLGILEKSSSDTLSWDQSQIESLVVYPSPNNDVINVDYLSLTMALDILGSDGSDTIHVAAGDFDSNILGDLFVSGGNGTDHVRVNDSTGTGSDDYRIDGWFTKPGSGTGRILVDVETEFLHVTGSNHENQWFVDQFGGLTLVLNGGTADDDFQVGGGNVDNVGAINLVINAGSGTDVLTIDDTLDGPGLDTYNIGGDSTHGSFEKLTGPALTWSQSQLETFNLQGSHHDDTVNVGLVGASLELNLNTNDGNDSVNVVEIAAAQTVNIEGGAGTNSVFVDDSGFGGGETYSVSDTGLAIQRFGPTEFIGYTNVQDLILQSGAGDDAITVTNADMTLVVFFRVTVNAGGGTDTLIADDSGWLNGDEYRLTELGLITQGIAAEEHLLYEDVEDVVLRTGAGNDVIDVSTHDSRLSNLPGFLIVTGGGVDTLKFDDSGNPSPSHYQVASVATGDGSLDSPASQFASQFEGVEAVELINPCGSTVDTSGYDMSHFALTVSCGSPTPDGDFNDDGVYDLADIDALTAEIVAMTNNPDLDLTGDGLVDGDDLEAWLVEGGANNPAQTGGDPFLKGDANLDGVVDGQDFVLWNGNKFMSTGTWSQADWNADGVTDGQDFIIWNGNKFQSSDALTPFMLRPPHDLADMSDLPLKVQAPVQSAGYSRSVTRVAIERIDTVFASVHQRDERAGEQRQADIFDVLIEGSPITSHLF